MQKLFDISYLPLRVILTALEEAQLPPYLGSTLRGAIGHSLLGTDKEACAYLYENNSGNSDTVQINAKPYMIIPPEIHMPQTIVGRGAQIEFEILLIGNGVRYVDSLIKALEQMESFGLGAYRYPFRLSQIIHSKEQRIIWRNGKCSLHRMKSVAMPCFELPDVTRALIKIRTPLRIRHGGKILKTISFQTLIRNITNRIMTLTERYGGWTDREEAGKIQMLSAEVETVREKLHLVHMERYSNRSNGKMDFSGLMGEVEYQGDLTPFVPWLYAAQRLHVGRNTTFGMGRIEVYFI